MLWLRKMAALVVLSIGVALLVLSFAASRAGEPTARQVGLESGPPLADTSGAEERIGMVPLSTRILAGVLVVAGGALLLSTHRATASRPGIPIAAPWFGLFTDAIGLIWGAVFVTLVLDTLWVGPLGQPSLLGLEPEWPSDQAITGLHFVSVPAMVLAFPILTLFFTSLSAQRIQVDRDGITSHGALGRTTLAWSDLTRARFTEQGNPAAFTVVDFRKLQTVLELEGEEAAIAINQPTSRRRRQRILAALLEHAPPAQRPLIEALGSTW